MTDDEMLAVSEALEKFTKRDPHKPKLARIDK